MHAVLEHRADWLQSLVSRPDVDEEQFLGRIPYGRVERLQSGLLAPASAIGHTKTRGPIASGWVSVDRREYRCSGNFNRFLKRLQYSYVLIPISFLQ